MIKALQNQSFGSIRFHSDIKNIKGAERSFLSIKSPVTRATHFYVTQGSAGKLDCFAFKASKFKILNKLFELFPEVVTNAHTLLLRPFGVGHGVLEKSQHKEALELRPQSARKLLDSANKSLNIKIENTSNKP